MRTKDGDDALERLIYRWWEPRFSGRATLREHADGTMPNHDEDVTWIEDAVPVPIDDSADHQLLQAFSDLRHRWFAQLPEEPDYDAYYNRKHAGPAWCPPRGRDYPDLEPVSGEIPWRKLHTDDGPWFRLDVVDYPCEECLGSKSCFGSRETHEYYDDGTTWCTHCSCGENIGR